jgi:23S rRNA (cytosine1962-C5)-methyltransferase
MLILNPKGFKDYELIDSGSFEKLERFGPYVTIRPEPQALWDKRMSEKDWQKSAHVKFISKSSSSGTWHKYKEIPDRWIISYQNKHINFKLRLALTSFKHVGIFPEQAVNWDFINQSLLHIKARDKKFLNLFAYTGAASLAAKCAGADVTHVDSIKQVVSWANENQTLSGLKDIRWVVEDAMKFVQREAKRGNKYHGIIMDPPAYGHGANGESWKLEKQLNDLIKEVLKLLNPDEHFLILNTYSLGFSSLILDNLFQLKPDQHIETGELFLPSRTGQKLPLGVFGRISKFIK